MNRIHQPIDESLHKVSELDALIRELKPQLENSLRFNRINSLIQDINFSLLQIPDDKELFNEICKIAVESGIFKLTWIGFFEEETGSIKPVASCRMVDEFLSIDKAPMLEGMQLQSSIFNAVRNGENFILNDIVNDPIMASFHEIAKTQGYRSLAAFPIYKKNKAIGGIFVYSSETNFFTDDIVDLLRKVADTVSIRLDKVSEREYVPEEIDQLRTQLKRYDHIINEHYIGIVVIQGGIIKFANETFKSMCGYPPEETIDRLGIRYIDIVHPNYRNTVQSLLGKRSPGFSESVFRSRYTILTQDQREKRVEHFSKEISFDNMPAQLLAVLQADTIKEIEMIEAEEKPIEEATFAPPDFESMYGAHPFPHLLCDAEKLKILAVNDAALSQYGYTRDDFLTLSIKDIFSENEHQRLGEILQKVEDQIGIVDKWIQRKKDGSTLTAVCSIWQTVYRGEKSLLISVVDISAQKEDVQDIEKWMDNYKSVFNSIGDAVLIIDRDLLIIETNKAAELLCGSYEEELVGQSVNILIEESDRNKIQDYIARAFAGEWLKVELRINRIDGKTLPIDGIISGGIFFGKDVVFISMRDIEELRSAAKEYSLYYRVLEELPLPTVIADNNREIVLVNHAFSQLTGYSSEELIKQPMITSLAETNGESELKDIFDTVYSGVSWSGEILLQKKEGKVIETEHFVTPIKDEAGSISHFVVVVRDVGRDKKKQRREIQNLKWETTRTMLKTLSHDLNNLLSIVLGYASFIERYTAHPHQVLKGTDEIKRAVQRGANLLKEMVVSVEQGDILRDAIDINNVIEDTVEVLREQLPEHLDISLDLKADIPHLILGRDHLHHIIKELCKNARDAVSDPTALEKGRGAIVIKTGEVPGDGIRKLIPEAPRDDYLELTVMDNGMGMDEKTQLRLFDPFYKTKETGKGLGLTIVYSIVKFYGGFIDVESEPGQGSVIRIFIPVTKNAGEKKRNKLDEIPGGKETILVVEDENLLLDMLKKNLEEKGYRVLTAKDGIEGIEIFSKYKNEIDLIISDMGLPKLTGSEMYEQIRKVKSDVKVLIASGYIDPDEKTRLFQTGIKKIVPKPYQLEEILSSVREVLNT